MKDSLRIAVEMIAVAGLSNNSDVRTALGMVIKDNGGLTKVFDSNSPTDRAVELLGEWAIALELDGYTNAAALLTETRATALKRMAAEGGE